MQQIYPMATTELIRVYWLGLKTYPTVSDIIDFLLGTNKENTRTADVAVISKCGPETPALPQSPVATADKATRQQGFP